MEQTKYDVFISYKRNDKEKVFAIKNFIEKNVGVKCWIDLDGIESDAQFVNVIMNAIDKSTVFLFMYSHTHSIIEDYETDWTVREINYAQSLKKRIVFINIDSSPLTNYFIFMFPQKQQVDGTSENAKNKLCKDLIKWLKIENLECKPNMVSESHYKVVNDTKSQPKIIKKINRDKEKKENLIDLSNKSHQSALDDNRQGNRNVTPNKKSIIIVKFAQTIKQGWLWLAVFIGLLAIVFLMFRQKTDDQPMTDTYVADSSAVVLAGPSHHEDDLIVKADSSKQEEVARELDKNEGAKESETKNLSQKERFVAAQKNNDWNSMRKLADEGYSPAYMPLAYHYVKEPSTHHLADKYAQKAKKLGDPNADIIIKILTEYDYY